MSDHMKPKALTGLALWKASGDGGAEGRAVVEVAVSMSKEEAEGCIERIRTCIAEVRREAKRLYDGEGWRALGYASFAECMSDQLGYGSSHSYRLVEAARVEENLGDSPVGEPVPESHLRPLARLGAAEQREAYERALDTAPDGRVTAAHVERVVKEMKGEKEPAPCANISVEDVGATEQAAPGECEPGEHGTEPEIPVQAVGSGDALEVLEVKVARGAHALKQIREGTLYGDQYECFGDYCRERWGIVLCDDGAGGSSQPEEQREVGCGGPAAAEAPKRTIRKGDRVTTPDGEGEVLQVRRDALTVHLDGRDEAPQYAPEIVALAA